MMTTRNTHIRPVAGGRYRVDRPDGTTTYLAGHQLAQLVPVEDLDVDVIGGRVRVCSAREALRRREEDIQVGQALWRFRGAVCVLLAALLAVAGIFVSAFTLPPALVLVALAVLSLAAALAHLGTPSTARCARIGRRQRERDARREEG